VKKSKKSDKLPRKVAKEVQAIESEAKLLTRVIRVFWRKESIYIAFAIILILSFGFGVYLKEVSKLRRAWAALPKGRLLGSEFKNLNYVKKQGNCVIFYSSYLTVGVNQDWVSEDKADRVAAQCAKSYPIYQNQFKMKPPVVTITNPDARELYRGAGIPLNSNNQTNMMPVFIYNSDGTFGGYSYIPGNPESDRKITGISQYIAVNSRQNYALENGNSCIPGITQCAGSKNVYEHTIAHEVFHSLSYSADKEASLRGNTYETLAQWAAAYTIPFDKNNQAQGGNLGPFLRGIGSDMRVTLKDEIWRYNPFPLIEYVRTTSKNGDAYVVSKKVVGSKDLIAQLAKDRGKAFPLFWQKFWITSILGNYSNQNFNYVLEGNFWEEQNFDSQGKPNGTLTFSKFTQNQVVKGSSISSSLKPVSANIYGLAAGKNDHLSTVQVKNSSKYNAVYATLIVYKPGQKGTAIVTKAVPKGGKTVALGQIDINQYYLVLVSNSSQSKTANIKIYTTVPKITVNTYNDNNFNNKRGADEPLASNYQYKIYSYNGTSRSYWKTVTSKNGAVTFDAAPKKYYIEQVPKGGLITTGNPGKDLNVTPTSKVSSISFGIRKTPVVRIQTYLDGNNNGKLDNKEALLTGFQYIINDYKWDGERSYYWSARPNRVSTNNGARSYTFSAPPGLYRVDQVVQSCCYVNTNKTQKTVTTNVKSPAVTYLNFGVNFIIKTN
jgi:hypothetical protein